MDSNMYHSTNTNVLYKATHSNHRILAKLSQDMVKLTTKSNAVKNFAKTVNTYGDETLLLTIMLKNIAFDNDGLDLANGEHLISVITTTETVTLATNTPEEFTLDFTISDDDSPPKETVATLTYDATIHGTTAANLDYQISIIPIIPFTVTVNDSTLHIPIKHTLVATWDTTDPIQTQPFPFSIPNTLYVPIDRT